MAAGGGARQRDEDPLRDMGADLAALQALLRILKERADPTLEWREAQLGVPPPFERTDRAETAVGA
jgi:hypothetical protein